MMMQKGVLWLDISWSCDRGVNVLIHINYLTWLIVHCGQPGGFVCCHFGTFVVGHISFNAKMDWLNLGWYLEDRTRWIWPVKTWSVQRECLLVEKKCSLSVVRGSAEEVQYLYNLLGFKIYGSIVYEGNDDEGIDQSYVVWSPGAVNWKTLLANEHNFLSPAVYHRICDIISK